LARALLPPGVLAGNSTTMQHPWGHPQMAQGNSLLRPGGQFVQGQPQAGSPRVGAPRQAPTNMQQPAGAVAGRPLQRTHSPVRQVHPNQAAMPHSGLVAGMHGAQMPGSLAAGRCPAAPVNSSGCKAHPLPAACPQRLRAPSFLPPVVRLPNSSSMICGSAGAAR